jgi:hypothetical protein
MADKKITDLAAHTTPVSGEGLEVATGGLSKELDLTYVLHSIASIYTTGGSGSQTPGTGYVKCTQFDSNGVSFEGTPDAANDKITLTKTGLYLVLSFGSFGVGATSGFDAFFRVYWNSVAQTQITARVAETVGTWACGGLVDVTSASTDLELHIRTDVASKDIDIEEASLIAAKLAYT